MKQFYFLLAITIFLINGNKTNAQTVWTGPKTTFTKPDNADWELEVNQDRITNNVWLTRANTAGLFNIFIEDSDTDSDACSGLEPTGTEWAYGTTANYSTLTYQPLGDLIGCNFQTLIDGQDIVLHLITDDIYIDFKFLSWSSGGVGGFSYERSTDPTLSTNNFEQDSNFKLYPNPTKGTVNLKLGNAKDTKIKVINTLGQVVYKKDNINNSTFKFELKQPAGIYLVQIESKGKSKTLKLIKE